PVDARCNQLFGLAQQPVGGDASEAEPNDGTRRVEVGDVEIERWHSLTRLESNTSRSLTKQLAAHTIAERDGQHVVQRVRDVVVNDHEPSHTAGAIGVELERYQRGCVQTREFEGSRFERARAIHDGPTLDWPAVVELPNQRASTKR